MKLTLITTSAVLLSLALAGVARADGRITASLEGQTGQSRLIAASAVWNCQGATCVADLAPAAADGVSGCRELAKQAGRVAAYATPGKTLDAKALARCNDGLPQPTIGTASR